MAAEAKAAKLKGTCKWFNSKKGFGFITPVNGGADVFVHQSSIHAEGFRSLAEAEEVEYNVEVDKDRQKAVNVTGPNGAYVKGAPKPRYFGGRGRGGGGRGGGGRGRGGRGGYNGAAGAGAFGQAQAYQPAHQVGYANAAQPAGEFQQ